MSNNISSLPGYTLSEGLVTPRIITGLWQVADISPYLFRLLHHVMAHDRNRTSAWRNVAGSDFHSGAFASTIGAQKAQNIARRHLKSDVIDCLLLAVNLGELVDLNGH